MIPAIQQMFFCMVPMFNTHDSQTNFTKQLLGFKMIVSLINYELMAAKTTLATLLVNYAVLKSV